MCGETRNLVGGKPAKLRIINTLIHKMNMFDFSWASGLRLEPKTKNGISQLCIPGD